jgi:hypothetical protein
VAHLGHHFWFFGRPVTHPWWVKSSSILSAERRVEVSLAPQRVHTRFMNTLLWLLFVVVVIALILAVLRGRF